MSKKDISGTSAAASTRKAKPPASTKAVKASAPADPANLVDSLQAQKLAQTDELVAAMPFNATKLAEHGFANAVAPQQGATAKPQSRLPTGSTLSEKNSNEKGSALDGYPLYPVTEDIYLTNKAETNIDPEDFSKMKNQPVEMQKSAAANEMNFAEDKSGDDLTKILPLWALIM